MRNPGASGVGFFLLLRDPTIAEILASTAADFLVVDLEASDLSRSDVTQIARAVGDLPLLVRLASHQVHELEHALDQGVRGVIVPHVEDVETAARVAAATRYPPAGTRSVNPVRASRYFRDLPAYFGVADEGIACIAQIESEAGVEAAAAIARVDGIDGLFLGAGDLAMSLGQPGRTTGGRMDAATDAILTAAKDHGKFAGAFAYSVDEAHASLAAGFDLVAISNDVKLIASAADRLLAEVRPHD